MPPSADGSMRDVTRRGVPRKQQHRGGHRRSRRHRHRRAPRRDGRAGPLRRRLRRRHASSSWATAAASSGSDVPEYNYIDKLVDDKLKQVKVLPSELCTDARIHSPGLSRSDRPAAASRSRSAPSCADARPSRVKRDELVDKLVGSPEFIEHWTNKWADLLQVNRKFLGDEGATAFRDWIRKAVAEQHAVRQVRLRHPDGSGSNIDNPAACYYKILREPDAAMENTTQLFLAVRFNCNKCHDHPFERWTQNQYYQTGRLLRAGRPQRRSQVTRASGSAAPMSRARCRWSRSSRTSKAGEVKHIRTGAGGAADVPVSAQATWPRRRASRREQLAHWITSKDNPYFAQSYVNRLWSYLLGVGIIEPVDDIRAGNPPTNPELLDRLTDEFIESGFNVQHMLQDDLQVARLSAVGHDQRLEPGRRDQLLARPGPPAAGRGALRRHPSGHRLAEPAAGPAAGRAGGAAARFATSTCRAASSSCSASRRARAPASASVAASMMLGPVLNLVNGPVVGDAISDPNNRIAKLVADREGRRQGRRGTVSRLPVPSADQVGTASRFANAQGRRGGLSGPGRRGEAASGRPGRL